MLQPKKLTQAKHAAHEAPTPGFPNVLRHRVFASIAATVVAFTSATTAGAAITNTDDRSESERLASDIVAEAAAADPQWQEVPVMETILPVKNQGTKDVEKSEAAEMPEEEPVEPVEEETSEASSGPSVDIAADCSEYSGNKAVGCTMTLDAGWGLDEFACLESLWDRESGWNEQAYNEGSGAYGIPQALPGDKMAANGDDWETNPATQISWGLDYIEGRYGSPCGAWSHSESNGWY
ncbi:lytic transglycosylase domain-containing protein [Glycomyces arizonensis]|uniref:aggregation-promoting factor C-terminal-like domain-containing protein n=1 Tax=Glycomyces arizonensis TaxID=256035 RepID=UPI0003FA3207|nr:lytic transglycosylase domain-containing protein [Glycomyces arizonensis]